MILSWACSALAQSDLGVFAGWVTFFFGALGDKNGQFGNCWQSQPDFWVQRKMGLSWLNQIFWKNKNADRIGRAQSDLSGEKLDWAGSIWICEKRLGMRWLNLNFVENLRVSYLNPNLRKIHGISSGRLGPHLFPFFFLALAGAQSEIFGKEMFSQKICIGSDRLWKARGKSVLTL